MGGGLEPARDFQSRSYSFYIFTSEKWGAGFSRRGASAPLLQFLHFHEREMGGGL
jgi:hypothetical protein